MKSVQSLPNGEVICVLFFLSGFSGLIFEVVWTRILLRSLGVGTTAGACVLAAFMGGLALGAALSSRFPRSVNGLLLFAALELVCGLCGLAIPWLLAATPPVEMQSLPTLATAFTVLLLPCTAMGASYPTLVRYLRRPNAEPSMILYAVNVAGATMGAITCGFLLLPALGLFRTSAVGSILELVVAAAAAGLAFLPLEASESESQSEEEPAAPSEPMPFWLPALVAVSSAVAIMLQLCWYRLYFLLLGNSVYSNATVVSTVLFGLAGGTFIAAKLPSNSAEVSRRHLRIALICSAISVAAGMYLLPYLPWLITYASSCLTLGLQSSPLRTIAAVAAVLVPSICLGTIFPLSLKSAGQPADQIAGKLYAVNCLGGMIGAGGCGMLLLPYLVSISNTALKDCLVIAVALLYLMSLFLTLFAKSRISIKIGSAMLSSVPMAAIFIVPPAWDPLVMSQGITFYSYLDLNSIEPGLLLPRATRRASFYKEGLNSTVTLTDGDNTIALRNDGKVEACLAKQKEHIAMQADDTTHTLLGALPVLLHKGPAETVLLIGMGSGTTASAMLSFPELKSLMIAELESAVCTAATKLNAYNGMDNSHDTTLQQRMDSIGKLQSTDGRMLLSSSKDSHDVIVCQAGDPWVAGSCNLYTREFWQLTKARLRKNGICCQWVQAYGLPSDDFKHLLATFLSVYPDSLVCHSPGAGEIILLGFKDGPTRIDLETLQSRLNGSYDSRYLLARAGVESTADVLSRIKLDGKALAAKLSTVPEDALVTDDRPSLEFAAAAGLALGESTIKENINWILDKSSANPDIFKRLLRENLTADLTAELARAFARIGLSYDTDMAAELMQLVLNNQAKPFIGWSSYLIDRSAGENASKPAQPPSSNSFSDLDLAALADQAIASQDFKRALELVSQMPKGAERSDRQAWIAIGQNRPADARAELSAFEPTTSRRQLLALAKSYPVGDKKAIEYMKTFLELNPWDYQGHLLITAMYCSAGDLDAAAAHVQDCLKLRALQPGNPGGQPDPAALLLLSACLKWHDSQGFMVHLWDLERSCPNNVFLQQLSQSPEPEQNLHTRVMQGLIERSNMEAIDNKYGYKMFESP